MGAPLVAFPDWLEATGPAVLTAPEDLINDAVRVTYSFWRLLVGKPMSELVSGGSEIRDWIMLNVQRTFDHYRTNDVFNYNAKNSLTRWTGQWRFSRDYMRWTDQEVGLNDASGMTDEAIFQQYKDFQDKLERELWTSIYEGLELSMWAMPNRLQMESNDGKAPYSFPCFMNEGPNRMFNNLQAGGGGQWTQLMGINNTDPGKERWKNHIYGYNSTLAPQNNAAAPTTGAKGRTIISGLNEGYVRAGYQPPKTRHAKFFESPESAAQKVIFTSSMGALEMQELYWSGNDRWKNANDPMNGPIQFGSAEIVQVEALDSQPLYVNDTGTGMVTEGAATAAGLGPRFYCCNTKYAKAIFNRNRFFERTPILTPYDQPYSHVQVVDIWWQILFRSRMRSVLVSPGAVTGAFPFQTYTPAKVYAAY